MLYTFDSVCPLRVHEMSDEQLMSAIVAQEVLAFEELHRRHSPVLRSVVNRVLRDEHASEDVVQEIFLDVWTSADRFSEKKGSAAGWLITIARRRAIDRLRKFQCRQRAHDRLESDTEKQPEAWTHNRIDRDIESSELQRILRGLMDRLPEAQSNAIEWVYFQGMSQREIAARMNLPLGTIKTRLDLALRKLAGAVRELMNDHVARPMRDQSSDRLPTTAA